VTIFNSPRGKTLTPLLGADFDALVLQSEVPVALYVTSERCPMCGPMRRAVVSVLQGKMTAYEVVADVEKALISSLDVKAVPTLLIFASGAEVMVLLGFHSADELRNRLQSIILTGDDE